VAWDTSKLLVTSVETNITWMVIYLIKCFPSTQLSL